MKSISFIFLTIILLISLNLKSQNLQINEVVSKNYNSLYSFDGKTEDWLELYNNSTDTINLDNYFLSDDENNLQLWQFPNQKIYPDSFLIVFASDENISTPELHTNFKISSNGEKIFLSQATIIDSITIPALNADFSFGRVDEQSSEWSILDVPSPKNTNSNSNHLFFSHESGFYDEEFDLSISNLRQNQSIRYTLDGSEPNINSNLYIDHFTIEDRSYLPNGISEIRTSPVEDIYYHNWSEPEVNIKKATAVKFASFNSSGNKTSTVYSKTYLVNLDKNHLKTISLFIDSNDLFNEQNGIYVPGENFRPYDVNGRGNYFLNRAVNANISIINSSNDLILNENCEIKIQGKATRASAQKSLKVYAKKKLGNNYFNADILQDNNYSQYKRFVIRNTQGSTTKSFLSDELAIELVKGLNIDYSNYEFCKVYINGEYWGIQSLRDKFDDHYFKIKYGLELEDVIIAEANLSTQVTGDISELLQLKSYLENNELSSSENYNYVSTKLDIESFIDYMCAEMFFNNFDWPGNNSKLWKTNLPNSKWRYLFYDLDDTFNTVERNMFEHCTTTENITWRNNLESTLIFRSLLKNETFKTNFISRYQELLETNFSSENTFRALSKIVNTINPEIQNNIDRWNYPYSRNYWFKTIDNEISDFLIQRPCVVKNQLNSFFSLNTDSIICKNKIEKNIDFQIFPNPNKGDFTIKITSENTSIFIDYYLFNSQGQEIQNEDLVLQDDNTIKVQTNNLANGVYFIKIINKGIYYGFKKFIINN